MSARAHIDLEIKPDDELFSTVGTYGKATGGHVVEVGIWNRDRTDELIVRLHFDDINPAHAFLAAFLRQGQP